MTDDDIIAEFRERAAIIEYDAELSRPIAESMALRDIVRRYGMDAGKVVQRWRAVQMARELAGTVVMR